MSPGRHVRPPAAPVARPAPSGAYPERPTARDLSPAGVLRLQRQAGNRAVVGHLTDGRRRLSRDSFWDELFKPVFPLPDPRGPASAEADFDVWAEWDGAGAGSGTARTNVTPSGLLFARPFLGIPAGTTGHVRFDVKLATSVGDRKITQPMSYSWTVTTNEYGDITELSKHSVTLKQPSHKLAPLAVRHMEWLVGEENQKTRELTLNVGYSGGSETVQEGKTETSGSKWELGGGLEKGPAKGSGKYESNDSTTRSKGSSSTFEAITGREPFTVKLVVTGAKPRPAAPPVPKTRRRTWYVLFKTDDNTAVEADEEHWLYRWWGSLRPQTREALQNGTTGLVLKGYASPRGKSRHNRDVAQKRIDDVMNVLNAAAGMQGGKSLIKTLPVEHPYGEGPGPNATDDPKKETSPFYAKRVEVSVEDLAPAGADPEYDAVERELIGRGEARVLEEIEDEKKAASGRRGK